MNPFVRRHQFLLSCIALVLVCVMIGAVVVNRQLARIYPLGSDVSPDGALRADYSYRQRGVVEVLLGAGPVNPVLILEIVDVKTGRIISRREELGDFAEIEEVRDFFRRDLPWSPKE